MLDEDALHRDASLASVAEATRNAAVGGVFEVGIAVHDDRGVAAEFEDDFLFSGAAFDVPADGGAAGEADELDALVGDEEARVLVGEWEHVEPAIGPSGLLHAFGEKQRAERSLRCGLQDHGASCGDSRSNFVRDQIDREIKGRDAGDGAEREAAHDAPASGSGFLPVEREIFAVDAGTFLGGDVEGEDGALDFSAGGLDGLAGFLREGARELLLALRHVRRDLAEDALALECREATGGAEGLDGGGDAGLGMFTAALHDAGDEVVIVRGVDLDDVAGRATGHLQRNRASQRARSSSRT